MQGVFLEWLLSRGIARPSVPLAIKGDSGTGKTAIIEGWCAKHGLPCVKLNVSTMDETDAAGIVVRDGDYARTLSPQWYDKLRTGRGVLFLDEFNCARKEVADTFLTLICSRHLPNGDQLSDGVLVVAAMNDAKVYDNYELSPAMRARFMWIRHTMSVGEWTAWFTGADTTASQSQAELGEVLTFPSWLHKFRTDMHFEIGKKQLLWGAGKLKLAFSQGMSYVDEEIPTTPRGLAYLTYWAEDCEGMKRWADGFIGKSASQILRTVDVAAVSTVANEVFDGVSRRKRAVGAAEDAKLAGGAGVRSKIAKTISKATEAENW